MKTRWTPDFANPNWEYGTNLAYLKELVDYWIHKYDWRNHEGGNRSQTILAVRN